MSIEVPPARPGKRRWRVLAITGVGVFLAFLDMSVVNIAFPDLERSFPGSSPASLSWVLSAYNIVFAALLMPAGRIADRVGRRRLYLAGLALFATASALCAAAPTAETLVVARILQATGAASVIPASLALALAEFPLSRRATAVGLLGGAAALGSGIGPCVGGLLVSLSSWRLVFVINPPLCLAAIAAGRRWLSESRDPDRGGVPDFWGTAMLAVAVGCAALGIVQGQSWGWGSARILASFGAAATLGAGFIWRSLSHPWPAVELHLFRRRAFAAANAGTILFAAAYYGAILTNVLFLTSVWGYSVIKTGLAITPAPLVAAAVAGPAGRLADRFGYRVVTLPGSLIYAAGAGWLAAAVGHDPAYLQDWLPGAILIGVGGGLAFPTLASAAVAALPPARFATGSGINATARQLGAVFGVSVIVALLGTPAPDQALGAFHRVWAYVAAGGLAAAVACALLRAPPGAVELGASASRPARPAGPAVPAQRSGQAAAP
ncbi:MAG: MFS transporter [Actinomycetota bacterium]|nr:MFS transporter [Actinomycetota bacterium]